MSDKLDEYQILLLLATLIYEPRINHQFKQFYRNEQLKNLKRILYKNIYLSKEKKFENLHLMTTLIKPIYDGQTFFDVMKFTNLLEGDLIRIYVKILDRLGQIRKASTDYKLLNKIENCKGIVEKSLEGIYLV